MTLTLKGGQNTSFKIGNAVVKPITEPEKYTWLANELKEIESNKVIIAKPLLSKSGQYIIQGYGATTFVRCKFYSNRLNKKLEASNVFHNLVSKIVKPSSFMEWTSPWSLATQVAWEELPIPKTNNSNINKILLRIMTLYKSIKLKSQFIHSDLAGNILFSLNKAVIIDISPEFRPVEYANTLLITDSIAWHGATIQSLKLLPYKEELKRQLLIRAIMFRLCVPLFHSSNQIEGFLNEAKGFIPLLASVDPGITRNLTLAST